MSTFISLPEPTDAEYADGRLYSPEFLQITLERFNALQESRRDGEPILVKTIEDVQMMLIAVKDAVWKMG